MTNNFFFLSVFMWAFERVFFLVHCCSLSKIDGPLSHPITSLNQSIKILTALKQWNICVEWFRSRNLEIRRCLRNKWILPGFWFFLIFHYTWKLHNSSILLRVYVWWRSRRVYKFGNIWDTFSHDRIRFQTL